MFVVFAGVLKFRCIYRFVCDITTVWRVFGLNLFYAGTLSVSAQLAFVAAFAAGRVNANFNVDERTDIFAARGGRLQGAIAL